MHGFDSPEETKSLVNDVAKDLYADPSRRNEIVRMILDARGPIHTENLYKRKDGSIFTGNLHAWAVRDTEGKLLYLEGFVEDISERKRAEEEKAKLEAELRQAQKLEAIGTLAGGIAHDFNNILQPMMGYTEMALNELSPSSPLRDGLEQVLSASLRAKELIRQILTISRSAQEQQRILIDISLIIKEALKLLRSSLPTSVEIRQNIRMGVALADPTQIHQVLMNLCTNAAHAMDDNGILEVRLSHVDLSESDLADQSIVDLKPGPHLRLTVSDTGCGMDASTMEHIFDPYFTTKEVGKGSGLGLAVVSGIVKRHEGAITVRSEPDKGTTFTIYIPSVDVQSETAMQVDDVLQRGSERILLVDDEPAVMEMGTILLEHLGYNVTSQTDSVKALEVFRSSPDEFDLVITDYTMPKLRGLDFAMEVLRIRPDMPIVLCTGFSEKITPDSVKELGVELLLKPYGVRQISEMVRKILDAQKGA
jgi:signal transduction histidine kinase/ActR/RegA family two-component response regulator